MRRRHALWTVIFTGMFLGLAAMTSADPTTVPAITAPVITTPPTTEPADVAAPKLGRDGQLNSHFKQLHEQFLKRRGEGPIDVLFLGDSITEGWSGRGKAVWAANYANLNAANFGISGDKTQHVLWRIDNGELDGISPKVLVLMIGTNNVPGYAADDVLKGDEKIIQEIHEKLPQTKLLLLAIFPRGADPKDPLVAIMRDKIITANKGLAALDDGDKTRYLDIGSKFLDADGKLPKSIMPDALHPNAAGYQIWADAMAPLLGEMLK